MNNFKPTDQIRVRFKSGRSTIVEARDLHFIKDEPFYANKRGYVRHRVSGAQLGKYILKAEDSPSETVIDHINGNKSDNRRSNIRLCTQADNSRNRSRYVGTSYKNIRKLPSGSFEARIQLDGRRITKAFDKLKDAKVWYKDYADKLFGEFSPFNTVPKAKVVKTMSIDKLR